MGNARNVIAASISLICSASAGHLFSQADQCLLHFQESGNVLTGKVLETDDEFPGIDVPTAMRRLESHLRLAGATIVRVDAEHGVIKGENNDPNGKARPFPFELTFITTPSGTRVRMWMQLRAGMIEASSTRPGLCSTLALTNKEPTTPASRPSTPGTKAADETLTNDGVVKLAETALGDEIVIAKIKNAPKVAFDVSTDALLGLKKVNVSSAVIAAMIERAAKASDSVSTSRPSAPPPASSPRIATQQDTCSGVELMGLYKNDAIPAAAGGVVEWLAKIRNNSGVTKIVVIGWRDMYGQQQRAQVQIRGGDIATPRLDLTQPKVIPPIADLRVLSCQ